MSNPSWRQLATIPESKLKAQILSACDIEPEVAGVCHIFHAGDIQIYASDPPTSKDKIWFTLYPAPGTRCFNSPRELLKAIKWPPGTPTGDALRKWLNHYGWKPAK